MIKYAWTFCLLITLTSFMSHAQDYRDEFTWDDRNWFESIDDKDDEDVVILYRDRANEYGYDAAGNLTEHYFFRSVVHLKSDKAVDEYNKIYINISSAEDLVEYNARVLYKNKPAKLLGEDALKEGTTEDGNVYNYFAVEGAEEGCIIEYYYLMKKYPAYKGLSTTVQTDDPIKHYRFRIISPWNLIFTAVPVNGEMHVYNDTTDTVRNVLVAEVKDLSKVPEEAWANEARHKLMIMYKLLDNRATSSYNLFGFGDVSQTVYENMHFEVDKKALKAIGKFLKGVELDGTMSEEERIRTVENYIKKNVIVVDASSYELGNIKEILTNKVASRYGMTKLCYQALKYLGIQQEVILTCSRYEHFFNDTIENYAYLDRYILYIPSIDDYLMPSVQLYRLGVIPYGYINNNGLFVREVKVGDLRTGAGKIKSIDAYSAEHSSHDMWITATIKDDLSAARVEMKEQMTGYDALNYQPYFDYVKEEDVQDLLEAPIKNFGEDIEVISVEAENKGVDHLMKDPYIVNSVYENEALVELAGKNILFKIGELIGPQAEMYQEDKRVMDVENTHLHQYYREIRFTIPDGYTCNNLDDLILDVNPFEEKHTLFTSEYKVEGNEVVVTVREVYDKMQLPRSDYEHFRAVINAAADFNKITLVLEKS